MRVKLSYTIDEEDVLSEAAKILNLSADDMNQTIGMFSNVQQELKGENDENKIVNINKCMEMIDDFRQALCNVDTRLQEITEIIIGYNDYKAAPPVAEEE